MGKSTRLGSLIHVKHGFAFSGNEFSEDCSLPTVVTPGNFRIGGGFQAASRAKTFSGDYSQQFVLNAGDLVISMTDLSRAGDTLGAPAFIPQGGVYLHNQRIGLVKLKEPRSVDLGYLGYRLRLNDFHQYILGTATGTTVRHTSPGRIHEFPLVVPGDSEQRAIAEVLGALDDKITANDEVISRSQELAALTWFRATRAQESELVPLSSLARFVNGRAYTKGATGTGRVVIRIAELNSGIGGSTVHNDIEVPDDNVAKPGDLLFAWSGSLTVARWHRPEAIINQHIFKVIPVDGRPQWLVEHALRDKLAEFQAVAADKATTMGHIQRRHLDEPVSIPGRAEAGLIGPQMEALTDQVASFESENLVLARTRDQLLPLLMSGKVTVKDAEDEVGGLV
ncbi:restriction endonuclease subunit S [Gordonia sputi]|uniref:restriction endonuclease subunit S n=1 Tax=Gordonia sputi TaxID=36823 RepID=UPI0020437985|nr:restriction endonuclease subunit S [Gordonia sputi]MCM3894118.1 restriction endonuclease subunit S [Gordonia sputi]